MTFQAYIDGVKKQTGKTPEEFIVLARKAGLLDAGVKATQVTDWLKSEFGLGLGYARAIYALIKPHMADNQKK